MFSAELEARELHETQLLIRKDLRRCARALGKLKTYLQELWCEERAVRRPRRPVTTELDLFSVAGASVADPSPRPSPLGGEREKPAPGDGEGLIASSEIEGAVPAELIRGRDGRLASRTLPTELVPLVETVLREAEVWLAKNQPADFREPLLGLYFRLRSFLRAAQTYDESFVTLLDPGSWPVLRLFCLDPRLLLRQALERGRAAVFLSATLTPLEYYRSLSGGEAEDATLRLPSPFPPQHLAVLVHDHIRTDYKTRAATLGQVVEALARWSRGNAGIIWFTFPPTIISK